MCMDPNVLECKVMVSSTGHDGPMGASGVKRLQKLGMITGESSSISFFCPVRAGAKLFSFFLFFCPFLWRSKATHSLSSLPVEIE